MTDTKYIEINNFFDYQTKIQKMIQVPVIFLLAIISVLFITDLARTCVYIFGVSYCIYTAKFIIVSWIHQMFAGFYIEKKEPIVKKEPIKDEKPLVPINYAVKVEEKKLRMTIKKGTKFLSVTSDGTFEFSLYESKTITLDGPITPGESSILLPADTVIFIVKDSSNRLIDIRALGATFSVRSPSGSECTFSLS